MTVHHPGPLAADFRRFYGLSLAGIRHAGVPLCEVADLAAHLPHESVVHRTLHEHWYRTTDTDLLRQIELDLRMLAWRGKGARPQQIRLPWDAPPEGGFRGDVMDWDNAADALGMPEMRRVFGG